MPANLNALIRYKTIDECLSNPYKQWGIEDLLEACAGALSVDRGSQTSVSERTIREDIRIMRSDILGFNAPIVQQDGYYSYENSGYSIWNVSVNETELLSRILKFILEIQSDINHPELGNIIESIAEVIPPASVINESLFEESDFQADPNLLYNFNASSSLFEPEPEKAEEQIQNLNIEQAKEKKKAISMAKLESIWLKILKII